MKIIMIERKYYNLRLELSRQINFSYLNLEYYLSNNVTTVFMKIIMVGREYQLQ